MRIDEDSIKLLRGCAKEIPNDWPSKNKFLYVLDSYVKENLSSITSTQIRNLFNAVRRLRKDIDALDLETKLRYVAGKKTTPEKFKQFLTQLILPSLSSLKTDEIKNFIEFIKALLCYHKFYEGTKPNNFGNYKKT